MKRSAPSAPFVIMETDADLQRGVRALRRKCVHMRSIHDRIGKTELRRHEPGFVGLARIVTGQQLSIASAAAIWGRLTQAVQPLTPQAFAAQSDEALRKAGLSRGKVRTLRALCDRIEDGLSLETLAQAPDAQVHEVLTTLPGIGPWTADIYLLFCLGRADAFAAGDLALQISAMRALDLPERPPAEALLAIAERWRPWRGVAAHLLWADYKVAPLRSDNRKTA
jgi:DNA-3-methyladenine glycosylase II